MKRRHVLDEQRERQRRRHARRPDRPLAGKPERFEQQKDRDRVERTVVAREIDRHRVCEEEQRRPGAPAPPPAEAEEESGGQRVGREQRDADGRRERDVDRPRRRGQRHQRPRPHRRVVVAVGALVRVVPGIERADDLFIRLRVVVVGKGAEAGDAQKQGQDESGRQHEALRPRHQAGCPVSGSGRAERRRASHASHRSRLHHTPCHPGRWRRGRPRPSGEPRKNAATTTV